MRMRRTTRCPRPLAAALLAAVFSLAVSGCGGDGGGGGQDDKGATAAPGARDATAPGERAGTTPAPRPTEVIGEAKGPQDIAVALTSAVRDSGGFVTVRGTVTNHGDTSYNAFTWRSKETELHSQSSVSGASLVDHAGRKRYLILRDTDGECLCTTGLVGIKPGESRPFFAQFPAPPDGVAKVDFQLPTMPSISIEITG
ncbi:hypothetical protein [Streptomyces palmae]|uniref:Secreted protein n=1 Tax=Streptomyces palmae TaxID=1701085 RepID=A0A4Z0G8P4_9ACTN|nr:hypothetical protein [Streptomyces palmae]TGA92657.1 hypothetical protein E4099_27320 [Streptomyces palmae]